MEIEKNDSKRNRRKHSMYIVCIKIVSSYQNINMNMIHSVSLIKIKKTESTNCVFKLLESTKRRM